MHFVLFEFWLRVSSLFTVTTHVEFVWLSYTYIVSVSLHFA